MGWQASWRARGSELIKLVSPRPSKSQLDEFIIGRLMQILIALRVLFLVHLLPSRSHFTKITEFESGILLYSLPSIMITLVFLNASS